MSTVATPMTTDEFLSLPEDDKFDRWLIEGELRERTMSRRSPQHCAAMAAVSQHLRNYVTNQPSPRMRVYAGDIFFRLRRNPDSNVGTDVAVSTVEQVANTPDNARLCDGPPLLAVEILSASDMIEDINEKKDEYLKSGTRLVWIVDPFQQTVTVFRPGHQPILFNNSQQITGDPELPGFSAAVADLFG